MKKVMPKAIFEVLARQRFFVQLLGMPAQRRYALRWLRSQSPQYLLATPCPWITFGAIDFLRQSLRPGLTIFEYGSGGSTLFWLTFKPASLVSVEHDPAWHATLGARISTNPVLDYRLVSPEPTLIPGDPSDPDAGSSGDPAWAGHRFDRYVSQVDGFPEQHFDLVLIDGRARPACIRHSASKVKIGGWLVLDNSDRNYYLERTAVDLKNFARRVFAGPAPQTRVLSETSVFTRLG